MRNLVDYRGTYVEPERECPECGARMLYFEYSRPHHNSVAFVPDRTSHQAVLFGRWVCTAYGQCEYAPG